MVTARATKDGKRYLYLGFRVDDMLRLIRGEIVELDLSSEPQLRLGGWVLVLAGPQPTAEFEAEHRGKGEERGFVEVEETR
jgi:hypothetical protein